MWKKHKHDGRSTAWLRDAESLAKRVCAEMRHEESLDIVVLRTTVGDRHFEKGYTRFDFDRDLDVLAKQYRWLVNRFFRF